jgi:hypothetical protein
MHGTPSYANSSVELACQLIEVYNQINNDCGQREAAAKLVASLAKRQSAVLDLVVSDAEAYATLQAIEDADPYQPNSFDVLFAVGMDNEKVLEFTIRTAKEGRGIPRWEAIRALCKFEDQASIYALRDLVQGQHLKKQPEMEADIRVIESIMGEAFVSTLRQEN